MFSHLVFLHPLTKPYLLTNAIILIIYDYREHINIRFFIDYLFAIIDELNSFIKGIDEKSIKNGNVPSISKAILSLYPAYRVVKRYVAFAETR